MLQHGIERTDRIHHELTCLTEALKLFGEVDQVSVWTHALMSQDCGLLCQASTHSWTKVSSVLSFCGAVRFGTRSRRSRAHRETGPRAWAQRQRQRRQDICARQHRAGPGGGSTENATLLKHTHDLRVLSRNLGERNSIFSRPSLCATPRSTHNMHLRCCVTTRSSPSQPDVDSAHTEPHPA